jgi:hypothetical protein
MRRTGIYRENYKFLLETLKECDHLGDLFTDGGLVLKWTLLAKGVFTLCVAAPGRAMSQAISHGGSGSIPCQVMWDLWWTEWHWCEFARIIRFSLSIFTSPTAIYLIIIPSLLHSFDTDSIVK